MSVLTGILSFYGNLAISQTCPGNSLSTIGSFPNTYYPGTSVNLAAGGKTITVGPAAFGTDPIAVGDVLLIMQMQGAQFVLTNSPSYGTGAGVTGAGYLSNAKLYAGNMEYIVAASAVPVTGGTLTLASGLINNYRDTAFNAAGDGQYTYQIVRVPMYYDLKLTGPITAPAWNGTSGGVVVLYAADSINFNGQTVSASGMGFRGGAYYAMNGGTGVNTDFYNPSSNVTDGPKGEGIAGTPRYLNKSGVPFDTGLEGYPGGSFARGAPGNAGGGGTDGHPSANDQNTGGGGGGNGGAGGGGGNGWSSASTTGGKGGGNFIQISPSRAVMGGGGGSGTTNNGTGTPSGGGASGGAAGGGIVIIMANTAFSGMGTVDVSGANGNNTVANDGSGGGGAGGTAILYSGGGLGMSNITVNANGGNGGSNSGSGAMHGPGGGGGGGVIYSNSNVNAASLALGGNPGTTFSGSNYGAVAGSIGTATQNITQSQLATFPITCSVLAMSFISTDAQQQGSQVKLNWTVGNEINTASYQVEKSADGSHFSPIASVAYKTASSNVNQYSFTDKDGATSVTGALYYRLKEIEWTGGSEYSRIVSVSVTEATAGQVAVYPNPVSQSATISFTASAPATVSLRLVDLKGSTLWQTQYQATAGMNTLPLPTISGLPDGLYFLQYADGQKPQTVKLLFKH